MRRRLIRRACVFLLLGASGLVVQTWRKNNEDSAARSLTVFVSASKSADQSTEDAVLFDFALQQQWHEHDLVVRRQAIKSMRLIEGQSTQSDSALFEAAQRLGLFQIDPVIRARLVARARDTLRRIGSSQKPTRRVLQRYLDDHADEFLRPASLRFAHVFVSKDRRAATVHSDAKKIFARIKKEGLDFKAAFLLGDPLLRARAVESRLQREIGQVYGSTLAMALSSAALHTCLPPVGSRLGFHIVQVLKRKPAQEARLEDVENQVRGAVLSAIEMGNFRDAYAELRRGYRIRLELVDE